MSKSIEPVIEAFWKGKSKKVSNTETDGSYLYLFGNCIAKKETDGVYISAGGYKPTITTQDRLNMLGAGITFIKGQFYVKSVKWDGKWLKLGTLPELETEKEEKGLFN